MPTKDEMVSTAALETDYETVFEALAFVNTVHKQFAGTTEPAQWLEERLAKKLADLAQLLTQDECESAHNRIRIRAGLRTPACCQHRVTDSMQART